MKDQLNPSEDYLRCTEKGKYNCLKERLHVYGVLWEIDKVFCHEIQTWFVDLSDSYVSIKNVAMEMLFIVMEIGYISLERHICFPAQVAIETEYAVMLVA